MYILKSKTFCPIHFSQFSFIPYNRIGNLFTLGPCGRPILSDFLTLVSFSLMSRPLLFRFSSSDTERIVKKST